MRRLEASVLFGAACVVCFAAACGSSSNGDNKASAGAPASVGGGLPNAGAAAGPVAGGGAGSGPGPVVGAGAGGVVTPSGGAVGLAGAGGASGSPPSGGGAAPVVERPALVTSAPGAYWVVGTPTPMSGGTATITVDPASKLQQWIGFGGTFNEAGWDALSVLSEADRNLAIRLLFSATEGANFAWGRIPIGASDYAIDRYSLDDTPGNAPDPTMEHFSIDRDKMRLIPYIKAALAVKGEIKFWGSPWSPPAWMKTPATLDGTDEGPNSMPPSTFKAHFNNDAATLSAYALYFARFVEEYQKVGITIDHVQPQNEPGYATRYPSCLWDKGLIPTFVSTYLIPTLQKRSLSTKVWFGTLSNNDTYPDDISGLTAAGITGVGLQWNTMPRIPSIQSAFPNFLIMQTEHRCGNYPFSVPGTPAFNPDKPANDDAYAVESWGYIRDWIKAGSNAYSAWNMVLDTAGKSIDALRPWPQNALLVVDRTAAKLSPTPVYYVFRHLSYFVDPGATRIAATGGDALAFKNPDGSLVAVLFNSSAQAAAITVALGSTTVQVQVPAKGWATLYSKG